MGESPTLEGCRFASSPWHICRRSDGRILGPDDGVCWYEAAAQLREQGASA